MGYLESPCDFGVQPQQKVCRNLLGFGVSEARPRALWSLSGDCHQPGVGRDLRHGWFSTVGGMK